MALSERVVNDEEIVVPDPRRIPERMLDRTPNDIDAIPDDSIPNIESHIQDTLTELGERAEDRVKIQIWRVNPKNYLDRGFLVELLPQEFSIQRISEDYGGGMFQAVVRAPRINKDGTVGQNASVIVKAPRFRVIGPEKDPVRKPIQGEVMISGQPSNMDGAIKAMMDGMQSMMERLAVAMQPAPQPSRLETLKEFAEMKALFAPAPGPSIDPLAAAITQLTLLEKVKALVNPVSGAAIPENPSDNAMLMGLAEKLLPLIVNAVQKDQAPQGAIAALPAPVPAASVADKPADETPAPVVVDEPLNEEDPMSFMKQAQELMMKGYVLDLVNNARANNDIEPIAQRVYEQATDELWEFVQGANWMEQLAAINKDVKLFPGWFERLHARLLAIDAEPDSAEKKA